MFWSNLVECCFSLSMKIKKELIQNSRTTKQQPSKSLQSQQSPTTITKTVFMTRKIKIKLITHLISLKFYLKGIEFWLMSLMCERMIFLGCFIYCHSHFLSSSQAMIFHCKWYCAYTGNYSNANTFRLEKQRDSKTEVAAYQYHRIFPCEFKLYITCFNTQLTNHAGADCKKLSLYFHLTSFWQSRYVVVYMRHRSQPYGWLTHFQSDDEPILRLVFCSNNNNNKKKTKIKHGAIDFRWVHLSWLFGQIKAYMKKKKSNNVAASRSQHIPFFFAIAIAAKNATRLIQCAYIYLSCFIR